MLKIAVIGTGIAGLGAGYALAHAHEVELFEANGCADGHANTVTVDAHEMTYSPAYWEHPGMTLENDALPVFPSTGPSF